MFTKIKSRKLKQFLKSVIVYKFTDAGFKYYLDFIQNLYLFEFISTSDYLQAQDILTKINKEGKKI